jgi:enoyl-CoA hydratase
MLPTSFTTLKLNHPTPRILQVTLNRPEAMNAINSIMMQELGQLWRTLYTDNHNLRCIILTGSGSKAFCAGADLKERHHLDLKTWRQQHSALQQAMLAMIDCPVPIIVAVNGAAFGGGLELTLASDFAYATTTAIFAQSETKLGIMPGAMGTQNLPRACGLRRAKELCFTAASFTAQQAYDWGIINRIYAPDELATAVLTVAETIAENAPIAVRQTKKALNLSQHLDVKSGYFYELEAYNYLLTTQDREEGINAFNEKRKPIFHAE